MTGDILVDSGDYSKSFNEFVYNQIPTESCCLDVGCWTGNLGKILTKQKRCIVDGIDARPDVLMSAQKNGYQNTYLIDLNNEKFSFRLPNRRYDVVICADVLEHLINPGYVLGKLKKNLKPRGKLIVSLPNVAFLLNRILLLLGHWDYKEFGTLDKTHLHFYTMASSVNLVESAGYRVTDSIPYNQFGFLRYISLLTAIFPTLLAYQTMIIAQAR